MIETERLILREIPQAKVLLRSPNTFGVISGAGMT
jgi:hypothetical protein